MDKSKTEQLLEAILQELSLLTVSTKATALQKFKNDFLSTEQRKKAYEKFDGEKTLKEISDECNINLHSLQVFVAQLIEKDLVNVSKQGNNKIISKSISKIAVYYVEQDLLKEESDG